MKPLAIRSAAALALVVCVGAGSGCNVRAPLQLDEEFASAGVEKILLLPVIDARPDRLDYVVLSRNVADATARMLRAKGYLIAESDTYQQRPVGPIDIDTVQAETVVGLAPPEARDFLIVQVERMDRSIDELGASYSVRLSGLLVDRDGGRVLWRDSASAANNLTGVFTVMSHGSSQYEAAINASRALFETLPRRAGAEKNKQR